MATYKKRGNKVKKGHQASIEDQSTTAEVFNTLDETASRSEQWVEKNQRIIFTGLIAVAAVILGFLAYNKYVMEPKERKQLTNWPSQRAILSRLRSMLPNRTLYMH